MNLPDLHLHPDVWIVLGSVVPAYLLAVRRHDRERPPQEATPRRKVRLFLLGMGIL